MYEIDFHADDYAASPENSRRILALARAGRIDSFSVMVNMGCREACMEMLRNSWASLPRKPKLSLHINLIDGFWLSGEQKGRVMHHSWVELFLAGLRPGRKRDALRETLSAEIEAQLRVFLRETEPLRDGEGKPLPLRIDGHVHTHMLPLVYGALTDALGRMNLRDRVRFIRCSAEPLWMFLTTPGVTGTVSPVNLAKNLILRALSHSARKKLRAQGIETGYIFGLALTGEMDLKRVRLMLPKMKAFAKKKNAYLEILSHPGGCLPEEIGEEWGPDDRKAFLAPGRDTEYQMLTELERED